MKYSERNVPRCSQPSSIWRKPDAIQRSAVFASIAQDNKYSHKGVVQGNKDGSPREFLVNCCVQLSSQSRHTTTRGSRFKNESENKECSSGVKAEFQLKKKTKQLNLFLFLVCSCFFLFFFFFNGAWSRSCLGKNDVFCSRSPLGCLSPSHIPGGHRSPFTDVNGGWAFWTQKRQPAEEDQDGGMQGFCYGGTAALLY